MPPIRKPLFSLQQRSDAVSFCTTCITTVAKQPKAAKAGAMHAHLSLLLACAAAFAPPRTLHNLHKLPALFAETADDPALAAAIDAAVALCAKEGAPTAVEDDRRLDFAGAADAETVRTNFVELIETVGGDADAALRIVTNNKMVVGWKPDRVKASFDAWVERCESKDEALDLVSKNPGLLFCKPADVKDGPLGQAKMIANAMEFFRFGK